MATIALGLGTSHSQHVSIPVALWSEFAEKDKTDPRVGDFATLSRQKASWIGPEITYERWQERHRRVQSAIAELSQALERAEVDAVITVGDDQHEMFSADQMPALAVYCGKSIDNVPPDSTKLKAWQRAGLAGYYGESASTYPGDPDLGRHIITSLTADGFEVMPTREPAKGFRVGHAFNFVYRRLMPTRIVPQVPVLLNTYFPPNQPTVKRCYALGQALGRAVASWDKPQRVAVVASGGLSHFVVDEALDRAVIEGLEKEDAHALTGFPEGVFVHGTSEIKVWIAVAGAMSESRRFGLVDYLPLYRTSAGSGIGACFGIWE